MHTCAGTGRLMFRRGLGQNREMESEKGMDEARIVGGKELICIPEGTGGAISLSGSNCQKCGRYFFPRAERCRVCENKDLLPVEMGRKGKIFSYTVCHFPPPGGKYKGYFPYTVGVVALEEGILIPARIVTKGTEVLRMGADVELCLDSWKDQGDNEIVCYAYRVAGQSNEITEGQM